MSVNIPIIGHNDIYVTGFFDCTVAMKVTPAYNLRGSACAYM